MLLMVALVATPPLRLNVSAKSEVASAPDPLFALYPPALKVRSAYELSFATLNPSMQNPAHGSILTRPCPSRWPSVLVLLFPEL